VLLEFLDAELERQQQVFVPALGPPRTRIATPAQHVRHRRRARSVPTSILTRPTPVPSGVKAVSSQVRTDNGDAVHSANSSTKSATAHPQTVGGPPNIVATTTATGIDVSWDAATGP
jgi:hypothetical protein